MLKINRKIIQFLRDNKNCKYIKAVIILFRLLTTNIDVIMLIRRSFNCIIIIKAKLQNINLNLLENDIERMIFNTLQKH